MKSFATILAGLALLVPLMGVTDAFVFPSMPGTAIRATATSSSSRTALAAKYKTMDEILALFPEDKPVLINFYDANTEADIKDDIFRAKKLLEDRATLVR